MSVTGRVVNAEVSDYRAAATKQARITATVSEKLEERTHASDFAV